MLGICNKAAYPMPAGGGPFHDGDTPAEDAPVLVHTQDWRATAESLDGE